MKEANVNKFIDSLVKDENGETRNSVTRITFWRHGDCLDNGNLSRQGYRDAVNLGLEIKSHPPHLINSSICERTLESAQGFLQGINCSGYFVDPSRINEMPLLAPPSLSRQEIVPESLYHWTSALAHLIDYYSRQTRETEDTDYFWIVNFTHSIVIGNLLNSLIGWQTAYNFKGCFERIQYLKGCDFITIITKEGEKQHKLLCGEVVFKPDMQKLNQLVDRYKISPYRGISEKDEDL